MAGKTEVRWTIKELTEFLKRRQYNKFDANLGVSGARGNGKSTCLFKIFNSFKKEGFMQRKHQVYDQDEVKKLLSAQTFGYCWDDEAINSGYKRDFQKVGQIELIKLVTNYRDNFNIYGSALPFFYSLDKALRELIFLHIHIIERGFAVLLMPLEGQIHTQDPWDTITNKKIEEKENRRILRNPNLRFRYHMFTTFAGYLTFGPMTEKQERIYREIKQKKRAVLYEKKEDVTKLGFVDKMYKLLLDGKLTREGIQQNCVFADKKYYSVLNSINIKLKDDGIIDKSIDDFLVIPKGKRKSLTKSDDGISELVPEI